MCGFWAEGREGGRQDAGRLMMGRWEEEWRFGGYVFVPFLGLDFLIE